MTGFIPPFPNPHRKKSSLIRRFIRGWQSWIHVLFAKSYTMKMGEIHVPAISFYIANEHSLSEAILNDRDDIFPKHRFLHDILEPLIGNSVFSANGAEWKEQREMVNPAFSHAGLERAFPLMQAAVADLVDRIEKLRDDEPIAIDPLMAHVAADIIYRTLFSTPLDGEASARIHTAFNDYQRHAQSVSMLRLYRLPNFGFARKARRAADAINSVFTPIIEARLAAAERGDPPSHDDILQSLITARHPVSGRTFSLRELIQQISTIFLAGHETAASAMTWSLYLLAACPDVQDAVRREVEAAGEPGQPLRFDQLKQLPMLRNVFRETLRLYPPVSFLLREVTCPTRMRDKDMRPGSMLIVSPWLIQRNPDNWEAPHSFDPDRFDTAAGKAACRHAYLPFGKGPRICVGAGFAQQEALIVLSSLIRAFSFETAEGRTPEPISRLTLRAENGVHLIVTSRATG